MDTNAWGLFVLVVYPLLQLPAAVYLSRRVELRPSDRLYRAQHGDGVYSTDARPSAPETIVCPNCRTENEPTYTFCHDCVAKLSRRASR